MRAATRDSKNATMTEDPEVASQFTATMTFSSLGQMFYEKAYKFVHETKIVPLEDSFNNIKQNFDQGFKIKIQTLMKAFDPLMMKEKGRRVKVGVDIQVKITNNGENPLAFLRDHELGDM